MFTFNSMTKVVLLGSSTTEKVLLFKTHRYNFATLSTVFTAKISTV